MRLEQLGGRHLRDSLAGAGVDQTVRAAAFDRAQERVGHTN